MTKRHSESRTAIRRSKPAGNVYVSDAGGGQLLLHFASFDMPTFADVLMHFIQERQIVDETGLTGNFEFILKMPTKPNADDGDREDYSVDAFRRAIQPFGFHLIAKRDSIPVLIINHLDKPTPN